MGAEVKQEGHALSAVLTSHVLPSHVAVAQALWSSVVRHVPPDRLQALCKQWLPLTQRRLSSALWFVILSFLDASCMAVVERVCRQWRGVSLESPYREFTVPERSEDDECFPLVVPWERVVPRLHSVHTLQLSMYGVAARDLQTLAKACPCLTSVHINEHLFSHRQQGWIDLWLMVLAQTLGAQLQTVTVSLDSQHMLLHCTDTLSTALKAMSSLTHLQLPIKLKGEPLEWPPSLTDLGGCSVHTDDGLGQLPLQLRRLHLQALELGDLQFQSVQWVQRLECLHVDDGVSLKPWPRMPALRELRLDVYGFCWSSLATLMRSPTLVSVACRTRGPTCAENEEGCETCGATTVQGSMYPSLEKFDLTMDASHTSASALLCTAFQLHWLDLTRLQVDHVDAWMSKPKAYQWFRQALPDLRRLRHLELANGSRYRGVNTVALWRSVARCPTLESVRWVHIQPLVDQFILDQVTIDLLDLSLPVLRRVRVIDSRHGVHNTHLWQRWGLANPTRAPLLLQFKVHRDQLMEPEHWWPIGQHHFGCLHVCCEYTDEAS